MVDKEEKYLAAVFGVVIFIILLIILLALINASTAFSHVNFDVPPSTITTKKVEQILNNDDKIKYNKDLANNNFLLAINNLIKNKNSFNGSNLFDSDKDKFIFAYTYFKNKEQVEKIDDILIQNYVMRIFRTKLDGTQISAYYSDNGYYYEIDNNIQYILKVADVRVNGDYTYIDVDVLEYSEELNDYTITTYSDSSVIKTGVIKAQNIEGSLYLNSFALLDREDER